MHGGEPGGGKCTDLGSLPHSELEQQPATGAQQPPRLRDQRPVSFQAVLARDESAFRIVVANLGLERVPLRFANVGRIRHHRVRRAEPRLGWGGEIAFHEFDAVQDVVPPSVAARDVERGARAIEGVQAKIVPLHGGRDDDATAPRAEIDDPTVGRGDREEFVDEHLRFGPRDQHVGRHAEREPMELLLPRNVLGGFTIRAAPNPSVEALRGVPIDRLRALQQQLAASFVQQQAEQVKRFVAGFRQPGLAQRGFGRDQQLTDGPSGQASTSCLSRSA